jgi:alkaline phosphatase
MATKAVDLLSKNPKGYFLLVEGGKIDMGSHLNNAKRTLTETVEFSKAIQAVLDKVNLDDTLVIVTADHSHGLVISGYAARNAPILGLAGNEGEPILAGDGKPYTVLSFATGPGGVEGSNLRADPTKEDTDDVDYHQNATANLPSSPTRARTWACSPTGRAPIWSTAWSRRATSTRSCATPTGFDAAAK